jgi:hypothetical protein
VLPAKWMWNHGQLQNEDNDASMIPPTINRAEVSAAGQSKQAPFPIANRRSDDVVGPVPPQIDWSAVAAPPGR